MSFAHPRKLLACALFLFVAQSPVWASCGSAACPLDTRSAFATQKGSIRLGYEFEFIDQDQPRIGTKKATVGEISGHHDEERTVNRTHRVTGTWGMSDRWSLDLSLPLVSRTHRHIHNHHGGAEIIPEGWGFTGLGDLSVQTRFAWFKPAEPRHPTLSVIAGAEFPTGKTHVTNADGDEAEAGITPGSGSYDALIGLASLQHFSVPTLQSDTGLMPFFASLTYKMNGKGREDYRLGNLLAANIGTTYPLNRWLGVMTQLNLLVKERDEKGLTSEEVGKTGGEYAYVSPGLVLHLLENYELSTVIQVPVYQRVNSIQLTSGYTFSVGVAYKFRAKRSES